MKIYLNMKNTMPTQFKPLTGYEEERLHELEDIALNNLAEENSFHAFDYLEREDREEYARLYNRLHTEEVYTPADCGDEHLSPLSPADCAT